MQMLIVSAIPKAADRCRLCREILNDLPEWFGRPEAVDGYVTSVANLCTFACRDGERDVGFASVCQSTSRAFDIHVMGVRQVHQRRGAGRLLMEACSQHALAEGASFLSVQTLGPSHPDPNYIATRAFYRACGFVDLIELPDRWGEGTPMLLMVNVLS